MYGQFLNGNSNWEMRQDRVRAYIMLLTEQNRVGHLILFGNYGMEGFTPSKSRATLSRTDVLGPYDVLDSIIKYIEIEGKDNLADNFDQFFKIGLKWGDESLVKRDDLLVGEPNYAFKEGKSKLVLRRYQPFNASTKLVKIIRESDPSKLPSWYHDKEPIQQILVAGNKSLSRYPVFCF